MITTAPREAALMQAICASPAADAPRLTYADWVEQHADAEGAARANFIRWTLQSFRTSQELANRSSLALLTEPRKTAWANGVADCALRHYDFVRGFVAYILVDGATLVRRGPEIVARCPLEYMVLLSGSEGQVAEIVNASWMEHIFALDFGKNTLTDSDVELIADSQLDLRYLSLVNSNLTMRSADAMAAATAAGRFPQLHTLAMPLDIYDRSEGGDFGMDPVVRVTERSVEGERLRRQYGDLPWLNPSRSGGLLYS